MAFDWGLVTEVVPHHDLIDRALQLAALVAANNQPAVHAIRRLYDEVAPLGDGEQAYAVENRRAREWAAQRAAARTAESGTT